MKNNKLMLEKIGLLKKHTNETMGRIDKEIEKINNKTETPNDLIMLIEKFEFLRMEARRLAEYAEVKDARSELMNIAERAFPVETELTESGYYKISFPALLPSKNKGTAYFVLDTFMSQLSHYCESHEVRRPDEKIVIFFNHCYGKNRSKKGWKRRDFDNMEVDKVVDAITLCFLSDDSPEYVTYYHTYTDINDDKNKTEVTLVPEREFPKFLDNFINNNR